MSKLFRKIMFRLSLWWTCHEMRNRYSDDAVRRYRDVELKCYGLRIVPAGKDGGA